MRIGPSTSITSLMLGTLLDSLGYIRKSHTTFCKIHEANDRFQCSTAFCTFRSPTDVTRHFLLLKAKKSLLSISQKF
ncbi:hypothetical protein T03_14553 [Trichinella britovi]|uniref:Uncharacterized protein n=1 Tax=Trichinella britovi TaxID=45882 RepID=A0A0V1CCN0_TRIBR|nr:hypothetical protein T03_14553 [Trichinella britovi]